MAKMISEFAQFQELAIAQKREIENKTKEIEWSVMSRGHNDEYVYEPTSIVVCKVPEFLKEMGFQDTFVFDRDHFKQHMMEKDSAKHAHGASLSDMLDLPEMLQNPVAIVTSNHVRHTPGGDTYKPLLFLCAAKEDGVQKYRLAVVQPYDFHDGLTMHGKASKVISYYNQESFEFNTFFKDVMNGNREMLYFNKQAYQAIDSKTKLDYFNDYEKEKEKVYGKFQKRARLEADIDRFKRNWKAVAYDEMSRFVEGIHDNGGKNKCSVISDCLNSLNRKTNNVLEAAINLRVAMSIIKHPSLQSIHLQDKAQEKAERLFAKQYIDLVNNQSYKNAIKSELAQKLEKFKIQNEDDLDFMYEQVIPELRANSDLYTLKNLGISLEADDKSPKEILMANRISKELEKDVKDMLSEISMKKEDQFFENTYEFEENYRDK